MIQINWINLSVKLQQILTSKTLAVILNHAFQNLNCNIDDEDDDDDDNNNNNNYYYYNLT